GQQQTEAEPRLRRDHHADADEQRGGKIDHRRADERLQRNAVPLAEHAGADRSSDEHESDQGRRRRAHQQVEIVPSAKEFRGRALHASALSSRHGLACPGHPRLSLYQESNPWTPGTRPGMTAWMGLGWAKLHRMATRPALACEGV